MDIRTAQLKQCVKFIRSKGPFPQGELVVFVGDFNVDGLLTNPKKDDLTVLAMLNAPLNYTLIDKRREEVIGEYDNMLKLLSSEANFTVSDSFFKKGKAHKPTFGICDFKKKAWVPRETFLTPKPLDCSNRALDYIFHLNPQGKMLTPSKTAKKPKVVYSKSSQHTFKAATNVFKITQLSDHIGVSTQLKF